MFLSSSQIEILKREIIVMIESRNTLFEISEKLNLTEDEVFEIEPKAICASDEMAS